jgi:hypothetical protein
MVIDQLYQLALLRRGRIVHVVCNEDRSQTRYRDAAGVKTLLEVIVDISHDAGSCRAEVEEVNRSDRAGRGRLMDAKTRNRHGLDSQRNARTRSGKTRPIVRPTTGRSQLRSRLDEAAGEGMHQLGPRMKRLGC